MPTTATQAVLDTPAARSGFRLPTERLTHWMTLRAKEARSSSSSATIVRMLKR